MIIRKTPIELTISLHFLVDASDSPTPAISSHRSRSELDDFFQSMNKIWFNSEVIMRSVSIGPLEVPYRLLQQFKSANSTFDVAQCVDALPRPDRKVINGFYLPYLPPPDNTLFERPRNGTSWPDLGVFVVLDEPTLHEMPMQPRTDRGFGRRVTNHEIGHILGLPDLERMENWDRLMYKGSTGTRLTTSELTKANERARVLQSQRFS